VRKGDIVIALAAILLAMKSDNQIINIEDEHCLDRAKAQQLAKIVEFIPNLED
jgi:hypothetical protein